ncbi:MAG: hypothetical protein KF901_31600 [Myxococcales bacterium]|nr:hypothetical protein [Myxococcales bacterium]
MNFALALETLRRHGVEFVVVGGVAVVAHGASLMTRDLDILYRLGRDNATRLVAAFDELEAVAWGDPRRLRFGIDHLDNPGHHLAETRAGRLDALGSLGLEGEVRYETVVGDAVEMEAFGVRFLCISLDRLIEVKRALGRPRDLLAVQELEALKKLRA